MVAARRSFAGIELQSTASKSEGTGRERKMRGFRSGDSGHGRRAGRRPAMDGHGGGSGRSWGACWRKGEGRPWVGACEGRWSPREKSDQDGLGEEIDDALFFS